MTTRMLLLVAAAAILAWSGHASAQVQIPGSPGEEGVDVQATGRVQSTAQADTFTLQVKNMTFRVSYSPTSRRAEVRQGDLVRVAGDLTAPDQIRASTVMLLKRSGGGSRESTALTGTIRRIDRETKEIRVGTDEGVVRVTWDENTEFTRERTRAGPREFAVGDAVRVVGRRTNRTEMTARRVLFGGKPGWTNNGVGEIVGIDARARELEVDFDGEVWTVRLAGAQIRRQNDRIQIADLRVGQDVRVTGNGRPSRTVDASLVEVVRSGSARD